MIHGVEDILMLDVPAELNRRMQYRGSSHVAARISVGQHHRRP
jgi:hypothetical protein